MTVSDTGGQACPMRSPRTVQKKQRKRHATTVEDPMRTMCRRSAAGCAISDGTPDCATCLRAIAKYIASHPE